jgi:hypothetical protein
VITSKYRANITWLSWFNTGIYINRSYNFTFSIINAVGGWENVNTSYMDVHIRPYFSNNNINMYFIRSLCGTSI